MSKKIGNYEIKDILGEGSYGVVKSAINKTTNEMVAIKIIDKDKIKQTGMAENLRKEVSFIFIQFLKI